MPASTLPMDSAHTPPTAPAWGDDLQAARAGDNAALERVLTRSRQDLRRYAEHHCVVNDVEDAVQESLFTASRKLADLRQVESFTSWLFRIVKRECNRMKRGWRRLLLEPVTEDIAAPCAVLGNDLSRDVAAALESLPAHYREIVLLRDVEGLTIGELADRLGLTREATKARLHRARALAREYLQD